MLVVHFSMLIAHLTCSMLNERETRNERGGIRTRHFKIHKSCCAIYIVNILKAFCVQILF